MSQNTDSWNEFDWENAFKSDDVRIHLYMRELPRYIDLPEEDELIMRRITHDQEYKKVSDTGLTENIRKYFRETPPEEDPENGGDWQKLDGASSYILFSRLARLWAQDFAMSGHTPALPFLRVACIYGQLRFHSSDLLDLRDGEPRIRPLKIAIAKRMLGKINFLCGEFNAMREKFPEHGEICDFHFHQIMEQREKLISLIAENRREPEHRG